MRLNILPISASMLSKSHFLVLVLGTTPTVSGLFNSERWRRTASRNSLLIRLRITAEPSSFLTNTPKRNVSLLSHRSKKESPDIRQPFLNSRSISTLFFRETNPGNLFFSANARGQSFSAFSSSSIQDTPSAHSTHALTESVVIEHLTVRRLICSFHLSSTSI